MLIGDVGTNTPFRQGQQTAFPGCRGIDVSDEPRTDVETEQDGQIVRPVNDSFDMIAMECDSMAQSRVSPDEIWSAFIDDGVSQ
jgi:hypothetical protein